MKKSIISVYALFLGLIAGCHSCNSTQNSENHTDGIRIDNALSDELRMRHLEALTLDSAEKRCVDKINEFAFTLLHHIAKDKDKSFVIAPLSLASAIALPGNGDNGEIRDSIELLLGPIDNANSFFKKYLAALPHNEYSDCRLLNYLAVNRDFPINKAFFKAISSNYDAMVKNHDFKDTHSVDKINDWFRKRLVEDTIKVIESLDSTSSLCLVNALEFKALWPPFDKESTLIRPFITDRGDTLQIPIMEEGERYASFVDREGFQAVSMPYYGSCYRMLVVLPKTEKLALFSQSMTHE